MKRRKTKFNKKTIKMLEKGWYVHVKEERTIYVEKERGVYI